MKTFLGIDLGTSSLKTVLINEKLELLDQASRNTDAILSLEGLGSEQSPESWWQCLLECLSRMDCSQVAAVGFSGQMHGLVALDEWGKPVCNAILWNDRRSQPQGERIAALQSSRCNRAVSGFLLSSLLWMKEEQPDLFGRIRTVLLPKDYLRFRLTGELATDRGDASGTGAYDLAAECWDLSLLKRLGLDPGIFPPVADSFDAPWRTLATGTTLPAGVPVTCGSGDHGMQLVGNGVLTSSGRMNCNIGTASQLSITADGFNGDVGKLNVFCHPVRGRYDLVGASLNGGCVLSWAQKALFPRLSYQQLDQLAASAPVGSEGLLVLPYLNGERIPVCSTRLKMSFQGMKPHHGLEHLARGIMEGLVYNLRMIEQLLEPEGSIASQLVASGGGARSGVLLELLADILQKEVYVSTLTEQAAVGAAVVAACGVGVLPLEQAQALLTARLQLRAVPDPARSRAYEGYYQAFRGCCLQQLAELSEEGPAR